MAELTYTIRPLNSKTLSPQTTQTEYKYKYNPEQKQLVNLLSLSIYQFVELKQFNII